MIAIIDYGMGNLFSIQNMLKKSGAADAIITSDCNIIANADGIILPGVGAFDMGMRALKKNGIDVCLKNLAQNGKPILGICLGMQLLGNCSEEGIEAGLGIIDFDCVKFSFCDGVLKVPHMGWDYIQIENNCLLTENMNDEQRYYFVHSYKAVCNDVKNVLMTCDYGGKFAAAVCKDNVFGVQFHPEKSHKYGMKLMKNFVEVCRRV